MDYYISIQCENCDEEIIKGVYRTYMEHEGLPVVSADIGATTTFECDNCGKRTITGDLDVSSEDDM